MLFCVLSINFEDLFIPGVLKFHDGLEFREDEAISARTSCALAGARLEGHRRLFLALFPPWPRATAINF